MTHEEYLKRRDELLKIRTKSFDAFDKAILSLATGSLALSVTFLDKIGKPFNLLTITLIFISWAAFFLVIVANLLSYLFAKANMDRKIRELDAIYKKEIDSGLPVTEVEKIFWQRKATDICNMCAFVFFVFGVAAFTYYIIEVQRNNYANLKATQEKGEKQMVIKKTNDGLTEAKAPIAAPKTTPNVGGRTEVPQALSKLASDQPSDINKIGSGPDFIRGLTEAPQAVQRPITTGQQNAPEEKK